MALAAGCSVAGPTEAPGTLDPRQYQYVRYYAPMPSITTLGPTGARGHATMNRIRVTDVSLDSPAYGVLIRDDLILGANGRPFQPGEDARAALGNAITAAESERRAGKLELIVLRDGRLGTARMIIPAVGDYSPTWPFDCRKSERILEAAAAYVAEECHPAAAFVAREFNGLLLLAEGSPGSLDSARYIAHEIARMELPAGPHKHGSWEAGYATLFLAEYYLATGDRQVLPAMQRFVDHLVKGQMQCGSWAHGVRWNYYGAVNQTGLSSLLALLVAAECGISVPEQSMKRSADFFARFAGRGGIPYGDHQPELHQSGNGRDALAALALSFSGAYGDAPAEFARMVVASTPHREQGHTGCYTGLVWGPIGLHAVAPAGGLRKLIDHWRWHYDLARTGDGGLVYQPSWHWEYHGGSGGVGYYGDTPAKSTGGLALVYALPRKRLRILGAPKSLFGGDPPAALKAAWTQFNDRRFRHCRAAIGKMRSRLSDADRRDAQRLSSVCDVLWRSRDAGLKRIQSCIDRGDFLQARDRLDCLAEYLPADDPAIAALQAKLDSPAVGVLVANGREYYAILRTQWWNRPKRLANLRGFVAKVSGSTHYGKLAAGHIPGLRAEVETKWSPLAGFTASDAAGWQRVAWGTAGDCEKQTQRKMRVVRAPAGTELASLVGTPSAGDAGSQCVVMRGTFALADPARAALRFTFLGATEGAELYINGYRVAHLMAFMPGRTPSCRTRLLQGSVTRLLKTEGNTLTVYVENPDARRFEFSLETALVDPTHVRAAPLLQCAAIIPLDAARQKPGVPGRPRPQTLKSEFGADAITRNEAAKRCAAYGVGCIDTLLPLLAEDNWRIRRGACDALLYLAQNAQRGKDAPAPAWMKTVQAAVVPLLDDREAWVRAGAARALAWMGDAPAEGLLRLTTDEDEWVRGAAGDTLVRVTRDKAVLLRAARNLLSRPTTSAAAVRSAAAMLRTCGAGAAEAIPEIVQYLAGPTEGMWLPHAYYLELFAKYGSDDPGVVPVIAKHLSAEDRYERIVAARALGKLGALAAPAIPALEAMGRITGSRLVKRPKKTSDEMNRKAAADAIGAIRAAMGARGK